MKTTALTRHTPLTRSTPPKRQKRRDPVTEETWQAVMLRDGYACVAPGLGADPAECGGVLQLDHVREQPMAGKRAPSDPRHLAVVCRNHHTENGWATSHRPELRAYLEAVS